MEILRNILLDKINRSTLISEFQDRVWNGALRDEYPFAAEILLDLAYDLDYYEPDPAVRAEDISYYGDERLEKEIVDALNKIAELK